MSEIDLTSKDALAGTIAGIKRAVDDAGGKVGNLEQAVNDIRAAQRKADLEHAARWESQYTPAGADADVVRAYTRGATGVERKAIASVGDGDRVTGDRPYAGGKDGSAIVRLYGVREHGRFRPGLLDDPAPKTEWQRELQVLCEERTLVRSLTARKGMGGAVIAGKSPNTDAAIVEHMRHAPDAIRKVFADNAGEGAEWIPDVVLTELYRKAEAPRAVEALFGRMSLPAGMGANVNPYLTTGVMPFLADQPASGDFDPAEIQQSVPATSSLSNAARSIMVNIPANRDAEEDSIVAWAPLARTLAAEAIRDGREDAIINGDTGTHGDTGIAAWNPRSRWTASLLGTARDHRYAWIGLRAASIDASSNVDGASYQTASGLLQLMAGLDSPHMLGDIAFIVSPETYVLKLLVDTNLLTVDKMGAAATLLTGQVGAIGGHPVVVSEFVDKQYNASGIYDDSTKTKTGALIVNRARFMMGVRSDLAVEAETVARTNTSYLIAKWRGRFIKTDPTATKSVVWAYNMAPS